VPDASIERVVWQEGQNGQTILVYGVLCYCVRSFDFIIWCDGGTSR